MIQNLLHFFEKHGFFVASRLADKLGMRATNVRLFFIYISFITVGLGFGFYLTLAFILKLTISSPIALNAMALEASPTNVIGPSTLTCTDTFLI